MSWWRRLFFGPPPESSRQSAAAARAELLDRLDRLQGDVAKLASSAGQADLVDRSDQLLTEIAKLGREQFRATTLLEGHDTVLEELAEAAREEQRRREEAALQERRARAELESRVRLEVVKELLSVADALDASVRASRDLLTALRDAPPSAPPGAQPPRPSWLSWLRTPVTSPPTDETTSETVGDRSAALDAWLRGVLLIEGRLQSLLEREGVRPMQALGESFDPHRHLAVATSHEHSASDGTVVAEELRGYMAGDRVLRHAEVVVARAEGACRRSDPGADENNLRKSTWAEL